MKAFIALPAALIAALALLLAFVGSAAATYPGSNNGRIAFGATVDGNTDIYTVLPGGEDIAAQSAPASIRSLSSTPSSISGRSAAR